MSVARASLFSKLEVTGFRTLGLGLIGVGAVSIIVWIGTLALTLVGALQSGVPVLLQVFILGMSALIVVIGKRALSIRSKDDVMAELDDLEKRRDELERRVNQD